MKMMSSAPCSIERERTYPCLVAIDLLLHWFLCAGILACACSLVWIILLNSAPQVPLQLMHFLLKLRG